MESNSMSGGLYSNTNNPGMLGLEMSLHPHIPTQNPPQIPHPQHPAMLYCHHEPDYPPQTHQTAKKSYPFASKSKNQTLTLSDDDEHGAISVENSADDGKQKTSLWQRMKWTDDMVRLLIMVVFYIGDEVGSEGGESVIKKKCGGVLQKKGKWKSVSRALMERGFYVSPQQCEDKFNDLNKRYKRVNDILGKGTACQVVENQSLLDGMDHLSVKLKEEVKKLLNSKHLFFREMCAYHNSCGHGANAGAGGEKWTETVGFQMAAPEPAARENKCLHLPENVRNMNRGENEGSRMAKRVGAEDDEDDENVDEDEDDDEDDDGEDDSNDANETSSTKRQKKGTLIQQLDVELMNMLQEGTKSPYEKRVWMRDRMMQLEEQRVGIQWRTLELEKQRLKWLKFSTKKEREMEREKLTNERLKLENERMVLLIRQKEEDFLDHHRPDRHRPTTIKKSDPSSITG